MDDHLNKIFVHERQHNKAILNLLEQTTIGTNGAKYRHLSTRYKIETLHKPHFFTIYRHNKAIANLTFCERPLYIKSEKVDTFYLRYFAFDSRFQIKSSGLNKKKDSKFQAYISALLETSNLNLLKPEKKPIVFWAVIDPENNRSLQMANRFNFESVAKVKTIAFSRFFPRLNQNVYVLKEREKDKTWALIQSFYSNHTNLSKVSLFKQNNYFVYKIKDEIIAGIQANPTEWKIENLPGLKGKLLVKLLPYIPLLNKIINPKQYQFLATEGLFWKAGHEDKVKPLLESVLSLQNQHSLLIWIDSKDERLSHTLYKSSLGTLQKLKSDQEVEILAKFNNFPINLKQDMINSCHYISGFDTT